MKAKIIYLDFERLQQDFKSKKINPFRENDFFNNVNVFKPGVSGYFDFNSSNSIS
jgi:hypothetical protein